MVTGTYQQDISRVLITREQLAERVAELAKQIAADHGDSGPLTVVPIMSGAMIFTADLIRELPLPMTIHILSVSSYSGATTVSGDLRIAHALDADLGGRSVLVVDDIFDTGRTLQRVLQLLGEYAPARIRTAVLLRKPARKQVQMEPDYVGFDVPDEFVVGYGLDYDGHYRNYPEIAVLRPELYTRQPRP